MNQNYYLLNVLFKDRNRYYGAYPLRLYYNERLLKSMAVVLLSFASFIYFLQLNFHEDRTKKEVKTPPVRDSGIIINDYIIIPDEVDAKELAQTPKGTDNTQPHIGEDPQANTESLEHKTLGKRNGNDLSKGSSDIGSLAFTPITLPTLPKLTPPIYKQPDQQAQYKKDLYGYLSESITAPRDGETRDDSVLLSFVVELDGSLSDIRIERGRGDATDDTIKDAFQKISSPGMWKPASHKGKEVRSKYLIPIHILVK